MSDDKPIKMSMKVTVTIGDVERTYAMRKIIAISMLVPYSEETLWIVLSEPMALVTRDALLKAAQAWRDANGLGGDVVIDGEDEG